jgi:hypothetical protein
MSKVGSLFFVFILVILAFGIASFAAEFFFGRPLIAFIKDFMFMYFHK